MRATARRLGVPLHSLMTAAGHVVLHGLTGGTDLLVASTFANRQSAAQEHLLGWLANVTLLRSSFDPEASFRDHVATVSSGWAEVLPHSAYPLHLIEQAAGGKEGKLPNGQFGVSMARPDNAARAGFERIFFSPPGTIHRFGELELSLLPTHAPEAGDQTVDALIYYQEMDGSLMLQLQYAVHLFSAEEANRVLDGFVGILRRIIGEPDATLRDLVALASPSLDTWTGRQKAR